MCCCAMESYHPQISPGNQYELGKSRMSLTVVEIPLINNAQQDLPYCIGTVAGILIPWCGSYLHTSAKSYHSAGLQALRSHWGGFIDIIINYTSCIRVFFNSTLLH